MMVLNVPTHQPPNHALKMIGNINRIINGRLSNAGTTANLNHAAPETNKKAIAYNDQTGKNASNGRPLLEGGRIGLGGEFISFLYETTQCTIGTERC
jgi:hypothetical protein